ncbi:hypothetical protein MMC18_008106 [Xylographa bjoerkii]|nr:hypothetical protein [Xylographa bjoerkii]
MKLRDLLAERACIRPSRAVDANELETRLKTISTRASPTPSFRSRSTETNDPEECVQENRVGAYEFYKKLKDAGAIPSRPVNPNPVPWNTFSFYWGEDFHLAEHWGNECQQYRFELERWETFQKYQQVIRQDPEKFREKVKVIHEYQQRRGIDVHVELQLQLDNQTQLDTWKEYYLYEHRRLRRLEARVERAQQKLGPADDEVKAAESDGLVIDFTPETSCYHFVELYRRLKSLAAKLKALGSEESKPAPQIRYDLFIDIRLRIASLEAKLNASGSEESKRTTEIVQAREELEAAEKEEDRLNKVKDIGGRQFMARSELRMAGLDVEKQMAWLRSIEANFLIATEQAGPIQEDENHLDSHDCQDDAEILPAKPASQLAKPKAAKINNRTHTTPSLLEPVNASKVSKATRRSGRHPKQTPSHGTSLPIEGHSGDRDRGTTSIKDIKNHDNHTASEASSPNRCLRRPATRSILSPMHSSGVSKAAQNPFAPRQTKNSYDALQPAETVTTDKGNPQRSSKRISMLKDNTPVYGLESTSLHPIHSSRVSRTRNNPMNCT